LASGAGALVWHRARRSASGGLVTEEFHHAYRLNILHAAIQERTIERAAVVLLSAGIEPVLVKGWAAARLYPDPGWRPRGDIDFCVRSAEFAAAETALKALNGERPVVDLHVGFTKFGGGNFAAIHASAHPVRFGEATVRVPSPEDHLRALCVHLLREGAWRPLWLCDVAAAVESRHPEFDWDRCLSENATRASWVLSAIRLAHELLGANVSATPAAERGRPLPRWLVPTILKEWGSPRPSMSQRHRVPMATYLHRPLGRLKDLRYHWPNPIEATVGLCRPFSELPRLPFQLGHCLGRAAKFALRSPKLVRQRS
jgi:hypothetical protein